VPDEELVSNFLQELNLLLDEGWLNFAPRSGKTRQFMLDYELGVDDVFDALRELRTGHCYKDPEKDRNNLSGIVWFFRYFYVGIEVYIKISIVKAGANCVGALISFHPDGMYD
jgi:hypothetical protein